MLAISFIFSLYLIFTLHTVSNQCVDSTNYSLTAIDGTASFALGEDDKTLIFTFADTIDNIKTIRLTDDDSTVSDEEKYLNPKEECVKDLSNKIVTCIYDLSDVYGVQYTISVISTCNDAEIVLSNNVQPILPTFVISVDGVLQHGKEVTFTITPPFRKSVTAVKLVLNVNPADYGDDPPEHEITNFSTASDKGSISFEIPSNIPPYQFFYKVNIMLDRREIESATAFPVIANFLTLSKTEIKFPNLPFEQFILPLSKPVESFQILSVEFESTPASFSLGSNKDTLKISFSSPTSFQNTSDHTITVAQLDKPTSIFTIKISTPPTIVIPQTLFITDSPFDYVDPLITNPDGIVIDDIVDASTRTPSEQKYRINIDSTVTTTKSYEYKIETYGEYYFPIADTITIVNANFESLFNKVFDCGFLSNNEFTIDLTLISTVGGLSQTDISLKVFTEKDNTEITCTQQTPLFTYKCATLSSDIYRMELYYKSDSLPFYKKTFTLTSFNTERATFNLARAPFMIDFHDVLCDLGLPSLEIRDSASLSVPLICSYHNETISCELSSTGDVTSLNNNTFYQIFNSSYLFHTIKLIECVGNTVNIDTVNGVCVTDCKLNQDRVLVHNEECVDSCPPDAEIINGYCVDDLKINSETETSIDIDFDFETTQALVMKNFNSFVSYGKTISGEGYKIQLYKVSSPIADKNSSSLDARNIAKDLSMTDLVVYKVDKFVQNALLINVTFDIYTENKILIPKSNYNLSQYNISIPINQNAIDLTSAMKFSEIGVDIYNAKDSFFNDICFAYSTENDTDVILRDRRKDIFANVSFCPEGSIYKGIDFTTNQVQCDVDPSAAPSESVNDFAKEIFACNIAVVKCPQTFSQIAGSNIGLLCTVVFIITLISCTALFIVKDFFALQRKINCYIINAPVQSDSYEGNVTNSRFIKEEYDKRVLGNPKEVDNFPFSRAQKSDHRSVFEIFWATYLDKEDITSICFPRNEFEMISVNINYVMFGYCLDFVINALFYTDDQLSSRYQNGALTFAQDLLRSLPSNVISLIISSIFKSFVSFPMMLEMIISEVRTNKIAVFINKYYKKIVMNLILFHICLYVIVFFAFYYLTLFSTVYKSSQASWFTGCLYSILTSVIVNFAVAVAITVLRIIGIKCNWKFVYNIQLYIRLMM